MSKHDSWNLAEGDADHPRADRDAAARRGSAYEAYLAFDEITYAPWWSRSCARTR